MNSKTMGERVQGRFGLLLEIFEISHVCILLLNVIKFNGYKKGRRSGEVHMYV